MGKKAGVLYRKNTSKPQVGNMINRRKENNKPKHFACRHVQELQNSITKVEKSNHSKRKGQIRLRVLQNLRGSALSLCSEI